MPRRRLLVVSAGAVLALIAGSVTAFAVWSSRRAPRVALHARATTMPVGLASAVPTDSPTAQPTWSQASTSPTASGTTDNGLPPPSSGTPNPNQARLGTGADGRPILATNEVVPGHATEPGGVMTSTWTWDGTRWTWLRSDPQADLGSNLVYNPILRKVVALAGGITGIPYSMWGFDANGWANLQPEIVPSPGQGIALMTFDAAHSQLIALIPQTSTTSSTWIFNGATWSRVIGAINPPPPHGAGLAYDPVSSMVVLYGAGLTDYTWTWDGNTWTERHPAATPGPCVAQLAYDAATSQMLLLCQGPADVTMWSWSSTTWTRLHLIVVPLPAGAPLMTYETVHGELVYFAQPKGVPTSQTWTYANGQWQRDA